MDTHVIKVKNLTKKFDKLTAVDGVTFKVKRGQIFAFLGPNGAGKSTTIKMLTTLLQPSEGEIEINGENPLTHQGAARKSFGIVFQDPSLDDDLTALENMQLHAALYSVPNNIRKQRIEDLMKFVDLWDRKGDLVKTLEFR